VIGVAAGGPALASPRLRIFAVLWLLVYLPAYTVAYGVSNFVFLCNLGVILTALGLLTGSALLLSSQAVAAMVICLVWCVDAGVHLLFGWFPLGATAYLWDPQYPLFTRLLSLYHVAWPFVLLHALRRTGYDPRGYALQAGVAAAALALSRFMDPARNVNFAFTDPFFGRAFGPGPVHLAVVYLALVGVVYAATHRLLKAALPEAKR
jgi:hypothetical protein